MGPGDARPSLAVVFAGGDRPPRRAVDDLSDEAFVVAADSGVEHALALGWRVDLVVGDLDSADPAAIEGATAGGAVVERHPTDKDATDLELALEAVRDRGCERVVVVGGHGGRLDHFLANALLLASPAFSSLRVEARVGYADAVVVRDHAVLHGRVGDLCSLLALGGPALGVRTEGLRFPLCGDDLLPGSTRGVSNELLEPVASVSLGDGVLLAVLPFARAEVP